MKYYIKSINNKSRLVGSVTVLLFAALNFNCSSFVDIEPPKSELVTETVFEFDNTANSAVTLAYSNIVRDQMTYNIPFYTGLYGDELQNNSVGISTICFTNSLDPISFPPSIFWNNFYKYIFVSNSIIEGIEKSTGMSEVAKSTFKGEALFLRAFWYFYLVNLYGDVPILLSTDYNLNSTKPRVPVAEVYDQIIVDLNKALDYLPEGYLSGTGIPGSSERVRANKNVVRAFLARVYLYDGNYKLAEELSTSVINQNTLYDIIPVGQVFLKNSKETIWSLPPSASGSTYNTLEGRSFTVRANRPNSIVTSHLLSSFDPTDLRNQNWIGIFNTTTNPSIKIYYPSKYKKFDASSITEYSIVLRLSEQYLIRAEARAKQENLIGARNDLNVIKKRASIAESTTDTKEPLLDEILAERQRELYTEWGHRWFDLKRTGKADAVMSKVTPLKGGIWNSYKLLWPIARNETQLNLNLTQNPGYIK